MWKKPIHESPLSRLIFHLPLQFPPTGPWVLAGLPTPKQSAPEECVLCLCLVNRYGPWSSTSPWMNSCRSWRRCASARCKRDFTVPSRNPVLLATSGTVSSEKYLSTTTCRCSGVNRSRACRTMWRDSLVSSESAGLADWSGWSGGPQGHCGHPSLPLVREHCVYEDAHKPGFKGPVLLEAEDALPGRKERFLHLFLGQSPVACHQKKRCRRERPCTCPLGGGRSFGHPFGSQVWLGYPSFMTCLSPNFCSGVQ